MWPDRVSNPGPPTYESSALPIALRGPAPQGYSNGYTQYIFQGQIRKIPETIPKYLSLGYLGIS